MKCSSKTYRNIVVLMCIAFCVNMIFLSVSNNSYFCSGLIAPSAEIAYNIVTKNSTCVNPQRLKNIVAQQNKEQRLIGYNELTNRDTYSDETQFRSVNDTIGYGVLLGLLWKVTGSLSYKDICWLQIILFCSLIPLLYAIALRIHNDHSYAFASCAALLCFTGLIFINVRPLRDIWGFYALVILVHMLLVVSNKKTGMILLHSVIFALCQWLRPTIFFSFVALAPLLYVYRCSSVRSWLICLGINIALFWVPFGAYNMHAYKSFFVSCAGHDLLTGLGEYQNPWGIQLNDEWCADYMLKHYTLHNGTSAYHKKCTDLFLEKVQQKPLMYIAQILRRSLKLIIFYAMLHEWKEYECASTISAIRRTFTVCLEKIDRAHRAVKYGCLYIVLGWIGIFLLWMHGKKFEALCIILISISGASKLLSHLESRYLIPHYAFFCFGVGYLYSVVHQKTKYYYQKLFLKI